ncbi:MAG: hypothetical protein GWN01_12155 [Nitrosopumilaceae archaeon]|nr:hypothetical protein [Nitrosopumilaceae archaeon]NIU88047.1 hypothetical protein [Nitrosopumilaceae archaeon]NIX62231.1 hypothetical protein [Nitrosopumilaceae archaeon]
MNTAVDYGDNFHWIPACGGTEKPFQYEGKQYLYMWNSKSGTHAYYCITDDVFLGNREWELLMNQNKLKVLL